MPVLILKVFHTSSHGSCPQISYYRDYYHLLVTDEEAEVQSGSVTFLKSQGYQVEDTHS